ncbi:zinc finger protein 800-like [Anguilla rostrata]|uniref:zinc finger protein 800-like n=1 Tax=Anguilla rostrata TaxID=7938 RepID=UPI0030CADFD9
MEKPHSGLRSRLVRKQCPSKDTEEADEPKAKVQKTATKDKSCQTEQQHHSCCEPGAGVSVGVGTSSLGTDTKTAVLFVEPGDPPLLQQQLQTSKSGIQQIIECFRSGTTQLKHLLLKEVDTIFECKLCRSLFRGLPNLITHKEFYCFRREPDAADPPAEDRQSQAIRDLLEAIYPRKDRPEYVVKLDPIETNQNAVFQRIAAEDAASLHGEQSPARPPSPEDPDPDEQPADAPDEEEESKPAGEEAPEAASQQEADPEAEEEEAKGLTAPVEDEAEANEEEDYKVSCCLCGKDFNSHRSVRRHCRKMHKTKMDELCKFTETHTVPISLFSTVRGRPSRPPASAGRDCPMCCKSFATKANVRRHFDEVHRGLRRDTITPDIATKPGQPLSLEPPRSPRKQKPLPQTQYNLVACKCLMCRRQYSSKVMLGRHLRIVHKINILENGSAPGSASTPAKDENLSEAASSGVSPASQSEQDRKGASATPKSKVKQENEAPRSHKVGKLSVGFDFKMLYCKLCKRQFSSKQNLTKHIDMHTDGNDIYIKFYRCPICNYDSRRKRDVIRHITVVHKKSSRYLAKIIPNLESRAIKKPAEIVLNPAVKRGLSREDVNGRHEPPAGSPATRKQEPPAGSPATRKQEPNTGSPLTRRQEALEASAEVKVTKNFSLHACEVCGRAFAKQFFLEKHRRTHKRAALGSADGGRTKGRSTRSKAFI